MRALAFIAALSLLLASCRRGDVRPSNRTPVIVISIDTLRSDHLPAYGYTGVETPAIDALRADSILFRRAYSHVPLTLPSHATMFTGTLPAENGARDNIGFRLSSKVPSLPELLKKNGYATGGAVSAFVLRRETGMDRGFDAYDDQIDPANSGANIGSVQRDGAETTAIAKTWIEANSARPFFYFLHLYEPHTPYTPPEPYLSRYASHYDGEIARVDAIVGDFLAFLKEKRLYDDALIVLLSDHGEGLGDHGESEHGLLLNREALQVPLIVKLPRGTMHGKEVAGPVQLSDVFPTIASVTATPATTKAISLLDAAKGEASDRVIYSETYFPRFHYGWSDMHSLISGDDHYIQAPRAELYDLARDPAEKKNLAVDDRRRSFALRAAIAPFIREAAAPAAVSPEETRKLAALGYIGSAAPEAGQLPDPKDKLSVAGDMRQAFALYEKGEYEQALPLLRALVADNDRMLDVWDILSRTLDRLGQTEAAIEAAKNAFRLSPNTTHLALMISALSLDAKRLDEAEKHAELALEAEPGRAHDLLARVHLARGDIAGAEREARLALETRDQVFALMTLGRIEMDRKNFDLALSYADRAVAFLSAKKGSAVKGLHYLRGDALARLGRNADAEQSFRKEIELFPRDPQAYKNLILLCVTEGRTEEATKLVFQLVEKAPTPPSYVAISTTLKTVGDVRGARYWAVQGLKKFPADATLRKMAAS
ncbi:MAG: sulfatase-like hydrolase/transferase [Thermoanaerobaculia bacterium]|nr:sulfatase-like hydrolase/transferase [Thermoanaerobaculia bacterium]